MSEVGVRKFAGAGVAAGLLIANAFLIVALTQATAFCPDPSVPNFHQEGGFVFCCKMPVDSEGDYGREPDGSPTLNYCKARPTAEAFG